MQPQPAASPVSFATFGEMLRYLRRRARLQQRDLSIAVGYSESQICRLEQNRRLPDLATLAALFIPALGIEHEPALTEQLLALAAAARGEPANAAPAELRSRLPIPLTPLIDRQSETAMICRALECADLRLLTLVGPPGIGKTRLALQVAAQLQPRFPAGVCFVALAPLRDPQLVLPAIAQALRMQPRAGQPLAETLAEVLQGRRLLLLLDNCEHVLDAAAQLAELLRALPLLRALATSRAALRISGEHLFAVPPLAPPDARRLPPDQLAANPAVQLFLARAQAIGPAALAGPAAVRAIAEICACLDGLPLAIELAAARCRLFTPQALLERLRGAAGALQLLVDGPRDLPAHQQTLRGTLDWSYQLLGPHERTLLDQLAVFEAGCDAEAAEAVCQAVGSWEPGAGESTPTPNSQPLTSTLESLASLVDQSLVRRIDGGAGEARFSMLETIREYARERLLAAGQAERLRGRHARYFLALAQAAERELSGADQERWFHQIELEFANLRAAAEWLAEHDLAGALQLAASLRQFWPTRGFLNEGRDWLAAQLADPRSAAVPPLVRAHALGTAGFLAYHQGDLDQAAEQSRAAEALCRAYGDAQGNADALLALGGVAFCRNDYATAERHFGEALARYRSCAARAGVAAALKNLGLVAKDRGNFAEAIGYFSESLALRRELGDKRGTAQVLFNLAVVAYWQAEYPRACQLAEQSAGMYRDLGDSMGLAYALDTLGMAASRRGSHAEAWQMLEEGLQLMRELGDRGGVALLLTDLGAAARACGDRATAQSRFAEALALAAEVGDQRRVAFCLEGLALAAGPQRRQRAARLFGAAEALRRAIGSPLPPSEQAEYAQGVAELRNQYASAAACAAAWSAGAAASLPDVIAEALDHLHQLGQAQARGGARGRLGAAA